MHLACFSLLVALGLLAALVELVAAQTGPTAWSISPFNPSALPLAVRSPYLNTWLPQGNKPAAVNNQWSTIWTTTNITGWYASVTVDGTPYRVFGAAPITNVTNANQTAVTFTPTSTSFLLSAGPVQINATFLSPVEPTDLVRQSMPFSYFYMTAQSMDGQNHAVKMYSDISAEWVSGDDSLVVTWSSNVTSDHVVLQTQLQSPQPFTEVNNHAQDSTAYYSMKAVPGISWQIGQDIVVRALFANTSALQNSTDTSFRPVSANWPVFAIAVDAGNVDSTPTAPAVWALGVVRNPSIKYMGAGGLEQRSAYYWSNFSNAIDAVDFFLSDFDRARSTASTMDVQIQSAGQSISSQYADLLTLTLRQVMSSMEITVSQGANGLFNTSDVKSFMKNMGDVGSSGGINSVDALYASFPIYLYLNPALGASLLRPLLEYMDSSNFNLPYAAQNLGAQYPVATGNKTEHNYGIEESANMIIMTLAHAQASGDGTLLSQHLNILNKWATYLVNNTLSPGAQSSADTDNLPSFNQTNLALKGIIAIGAMAKICNYAGLTSMGQNYQNTAQSYAKQWTSMAIATDGSHLLMNYGVQLSSGLMYNLYADKLLQTNLIDNSVYLVQQSFYNNDARQAKYGLPLDNNDPQMSRTDWMMFAAATVQDQPTRDFMISQLRLYASPNLDNKPFPVEFDPTTANTVGGINSPAQGAMFSFLALNQPIKSPIVSASNLNASTDGSKKKSNGGAIAGGVIAGLLGVAAIGAGIFFFLRRRRRQYSEKNMQYVQSDPNHVSPIMPGLATGATFEPFNYTGSGGRMSYGSGLPDGTMSMYSPATTEPHAGYYGSRPISNGTDVFRGHYAAPSLSSTELGPSASQIGPQSTATFSSVSRSGGATQGHSTSSATTTSLSAKQTLVNQELRTEVENLRREMEQIREQRLATGEEAPPSYNDLAV